MIIHRSGEAAILIAFEEADLLGPEDSMIDLVVRTHARLRRSIDDGALRGIRDTVPAARTILVSFDPAATDAWAVHDFVSIIGPIPPAARAEGREIVIPVSYGGPDLDEVAKALGMRPSEVVAAHRATAWRAAFGGFVPGFMYLTGDGLAVPRRATPRTAVPAGSVALAGGMSAVYPSDSPGGWQLIGRTDAVLWDLSRLEPSLIAPGDIVRFVEGG